LADHYRDDQIPHFLKRLSFEILPLQRQFLLLLDLVEHGRRGDPGALRLPWHIFESRQDEAWSWVAARDGQGFVRWKLSQQYDACISPSVSLCFRRLDGARAELLDFLEYGKCSRSRSVGVSGAIEAAWAASIADHLGAAELAAERRAFARKIRAELLRRDVAVPFAVF
jgi:hypothetical protein